MVSAANWNRYNMENAARWNVTGNIIVPDPFFKVGLIHVRTECNILVSIISPPGNVFHDPTPTLSMVVSKEESLKEIQRMRIYRPTVNISMYAKVHRKLPSENRQ